MAASGILPVQSVFDRVVAPELRGEHKTLVKIVEHTGWYMLGDKMYN